MLSKEEMLQRLRSHPLFRAALAKLPEDQATRVAAIAEGFLVRALAESGPAAVVTDGPASGSSGA